MFWCRSGIGKGGRGSQVCLSACGTCRTCIKRRGDTEFAVFPSISMVKSMLLRKVTYPRASFHILLHLVFMCALCCKLHVLFYSLSNLITYSSFRQVPISCRQYSEHWVGARQYSILYVVCILLIGGLNLTIYLSIRQMPIGSACSLRA